MSATISNKLSNSVEGALAGGGDPASSPLYVFGPFLKLIVVAGVAQVTFGASVWLAVFTVITVSAMYRQVMTWVTDGSGGSGLSEEEFGSWAVKINASITIIEYTLTFLVSMAALVTFVADRFPVLNGYIFGIQARALLAIIFSILTCWVVNLGPKISARAFGPATAAVLLLLWGMIFATIFKMGFHLPELNLQAFSLERFEYLNLTGVTSSTTYLNITLGGYARILALMTGVEVFANLVAAYDGKREERSKKAFGSLLIIMGTTAITMLIVGPAIMANSDPLNDHVSVFTQTMDFLLPHWLSYTGTIIGVAVLLSAAASAAQGVQNLTLGLRYRHYVAAKMGLRNKHDVADMPVWIMGFIISVCFLLFGTREDTYLSLYAAGVFILLSMTGWAASKKILRGIKTKPGKKPFVSLIGTILAAMLTSIATVIIFEERFFEGAWIYMILVPIFYVIFSIYRKKLGTPPSVEDRLGLILSSQGYVPQVMYDKILNKIELKKILVPLSGSGSSELILPLVHSLARAYSAEIELLMVFDEKDKRTEAECVEYLDMITKMLEGEDVVVNYFVRKGDVTKEIDSYAEETEADIIVMTTSGDSITDAIFSGDMADKVIKKTVTPVLVIRPMENLASRYTTFKNILVALDGSEAAEMVLPYIEILAKRFKGNITLLSVPEGSESEEYSKTIEQYLNNIAVSLKAENINVTIKFVGSGPARTILAVAKEESFDLIMMSSHGRAGTSRPKMHLGSVTNKVIEETNCPVFVVPLTKSPK